MPVIAKIRYLRIAPRKVRLVADLIRGKEAEEARTILNFTTKKAAFPLLKLLNSAIANAKNNFQLDAGNLYISKITVDEGRKYKRWMARARGRVSEIQKKTSHISIILDEIKKSPRKAKKAEKAKKVEKPEKKTEPEIKGEPERERAAKVGSGRRFKPSLATKKPKSEKGIRKFFRRKSF